MIEDELGPQSVADDIRRVSRQGQCRERSIFARLDRHRHHYRVGRVRLAAPGMPPVLAQETPAIRVKEPLATVIKSAK